MSDKNTIHSQMPGKYVFAEGEYPKEREDKSQAAGCNGGFSRILVLYRRQKNGNRAERQPERRVRLHGRKGTVDPHQAFDVEDPTKDAQTCEGDHNEAA